MAINQVFKDKIAWIKEHFDCITYASRELGWPVHKDGDRYISIAPDSQNPTSLIVHEHTWHDFKTGYGGDVIDLCAWAKYDGDKGQAIRELGRDFQGSWNESDWIKKTQYLCNRVQYWHECLREDDRNYLHSRNITDETIERLKLGFDAKTCRLTIPYFKNGYAVYATGRDRAVFEGPMYMTESGEYIEDITKYDNGDPEHMPVVFETPEYKKFKARSKYLKMALDGYNENVPWGLHTLSPQFRNTKNAKLIQENPDMDGLLCFLEGMFDAMSFEQEGFICLSSIGGYFNPAAKKLAIDTARHFKRVFICFDNDNAGSRFNIELARLLFENRIPFIIGNVPKEDGKDVSDYYCKHNEVVSLVRNAEDGVTQLAMRMTDKREFKSFMYRAARFIDTPDLKQVFANLKGAKVFEDEWLDALYQVVSKAPSEKVIVDEILEKYLIKYGEGLGFFIYDKSGYWKPYVDNAVKGIIAKALGSYAAGGRVNTILTLLKARTTTQEIFNRQEVVNFPNGVFDLTTGEMKEHSPLFMTSTQMTYNYDAKALCPKWGKFINEIMDNDYDKYMLLQEMCGYILFPDLRLQKCFFLQGEGANGKSVLINVLIKLFGEENCSAVPMSLLASQFDPIRLHDSWVNFMTETDTNIKDAEARFKAIVAGDRISAAHKGRDAVEFNPRCTMISACNKFVTTNDTSKGFIRRIIFIGFNRTFEGKSANKNLTQELLEELPGIFNWVYAGYKRLVQNMEFTETQENRDLLNDYLQIMDPVEAFFNDEAILWTGTHYSRDVYNNYAQWCKDTGHIVQSRQKFTRSFKLLLVHKVPGVRIDRDSQGYIFRIPDGTEQEPEEINHEDEEQAEREIDFANDPLPF